MSFFCIVFFMKRFFLTAYPKIPNLLQKKIMRSQIQYAGKWHLSCIIKKLEEFQTAFSFPNRYFFRVFSFQMFGRSYVSMKRLTKISVLMPLFLLVMSVYAFAGFIGHHIKPFSAPVNLFLTGVMMFFTGSMIRRFNDK